LGLRNHFLNHLFVAVNQLSLASPGPLLSALVAVSFFQIMAWYAIFRLLAGSDRTQVAQMRDFLIALALCLPLFVPTNRTIKFVALAVAIFCWISGRGDPKMRSGGSRPCRALDTGVLAAYCL
jgi:hypothetical protein